jgi:hypothetical protein
MATAIVATESCETVSQVSITAMVKQRHDVDATELAIYTRNFISTKMRDVLVARPLLVEVKRRFKNLPREKQVNGLYLEIDGATSFEKWCEKHEKLIGSSRNAYYILNGGNKNRTPSSARRGAPWSKMDGGETVLEAFSTIQKDIRRCVAPGDSYEQEAIDFTKRLYFFGWEIWKRLLIVASEDIGLADISVSQEVSRLWEVSKTVKDKKHSDLLMLVEAVAICCRAKKSRAMDNAVNFKQTWTPMTDAEAKNAVADTTVHTIPSYANDGIHTGKRGSAPTTTTKQRKLAHFIANEDASLGNRGSIDEIFPLPESHVITQCADGLFYDENGDEWAQVVTVKPVGEVPLLEEAKAIPVAPEKIKPKKSKDKPPDTKNYEHRPQLTSGDEAARLYDALAQLPWRGDESRYKVHCVFGKSYTMNGGPHPDEIPEIPPLLLPFAELVAAAAQAPVNFIQIHRMTPEADVRPHRDPSQMVVPMLTVGQSRTFQVGGDMPRVYYRMRQSQRKVSGHTPDERILMNHGDLLIFTGGNIVHSMFSAAEDPSFNANGFEYRYSLLFRWTTDQMRGLGPSAKALKNTGHAESLQAAYSAYRAGLIDYLGRPIA